MPNSSETLMDSGNTQQLATYRRCIERITAAWPIFRQTHADRLRHGGESEKVAEAITEDLFTQVLDWSKGDLMYQVGYADIVVRQNYLKCLVIEVKRPGSLYPNSVALTKAVAQARRYADEQKIRSVAATDGRYFYAADIRSGGLVDRVWIDLTSEDAPEGLWLLSVHGIYRECDIPPVVLPHEREIPCNEQRGAPTVLVHPKYKIPAECFAYVPNAGAPKSWKLPYRLASGEIDARRLPKAIQSLLSNYRGARVTKIPESEVPAILLRLANAAAESGHMPPNAPTPAPAYEQLYLALRQLGLVDKIGQ